MIPCNIRPRSRDGLVFLNKDGKGWGKTLALWRSWVVLARNVERPKSPCMAVVVGAFGLEQQQSRAVASEPCINGTHECYIGLWVLYTENYMPSHGQKSITVALIPWMGDCHPCRIVLNNHIASQPIPSVKLKLLDSASCRGRNKPRQHPRDHSSGYNSLLTYLLNSKSSHRRLNRIQSRQSIASNRAYRIAPRLAILQHISCYHDEYSVWILTSQSQGLEIGTGWGGGGGGGKVGRWEARFCQKKLMKDF